MRSAMCARRPLCESQSVKSIDLLGDDCKKSQVEQPIISSCGAKFQVPPEITVRHTLQKCDTRH